MAEYLIHKMNRQDNHMAKPTVIRNVLMITLIYVYPEALNISEVRLSR